MYSGSLPFLDSNARFLVRIHEAKLKGDLCSEYSSNNSQYDVNPCEFLRVQIDEQDVTNEPHCSFQEKFQQSEELIVLPDLYSVNENTENTGKLQVKSLLAQNKISILRKNWKRKCKSEMPNGAYVSQVKLDNDQTVCEENTKKCNKSNRKITVSDKPKRQYVRKVQTSDDIHEKTNKKGKKNNCNLIKLEESKQYECDFCKKVFYNRTSIQHHIKTHIGDRQFICTECGKSFVQRSHLKQHETVHTKVKSFACHICHEDFVDKKTLEQHYPEHVDGKNRPFSCSDCGRSYLHHNSFLGHFLKFHNSGSSYKCGHCGKPFTSGSSFMTHAQKSHIDETTFTYIHRGKCFQLDAGTVNKSL